jgi:hypothetical protein
MHLFINKKEEDIKEHINWYNKYLLLLQRKNAALENWKLQKLVFN